MASNMFVSGNEIEFWGFESDAMYVIPWLWSMLRQPTGHAMLCAVLCPCIVLSQLLPRPYVYLALFLLWSPATTSPAQCMLF